MRTEPLVVYVFAPLPAAHKETAKTGRLSLLMVLAQLICGSTLCCCIEKNRSIEGQKEVRIPEGPFLMGSQEGIGEEDERPQHLVYLDEYFIDKYEVTNNEYAQCVRAGVCQPPIPNYVSVYGDPAYDKFPVMGVEWDQARRYCEWMGKRLPTEAEWEKAGRGPAPDTRLYPWGDDPSPPDGSGYGLPNSSVGSRPAQASPYGVEDLMGGAPEWVADWYDPNYYETSPASNPQGPATGTYKVHRGFVCCFWPCVYLAEMFRLSARYRCVPAVPEGPIGDEPLIVGFRCARSAH